MLIALTGFSTALLPGGALSEALKKERPVIVHLWDAKPTNVESFAIDDVSAACRTSGAAAVLCTPQLVKVVADEQENAMGSFPGPLPVIAHCALNDLCATESSAAELTEGAKALGAKALGIGYYASDWPEASALAEALQTATNAADDANIDAILLPQFGAGGVEGAEGAAGLASRVGAAAVLGKELGEEPEGEGGADGPIVLGSWDGSDEELQRLRGAGFNGLVLKNACRGDLSRGARTSSPSIAAKGVTMQVKTALSKSGKAVWGGAGSMEFLNGKPVSMGDYFNDRSPNAPVYNDEGSIGSFK